MWDLGSRVWDLRIGSVIEGLLPSFSFCMHICYLPPHLGHERRRRGRRRRRRRRGRRRGIEANLGNPLRPGHGFLRIGSE
jgi:hypothetical protein